VDYLLLAGLVREKHCSRLEIYDRLRASEQASMVRLEVLFEVKCLELGEGLGGVWFLLLNFSRCPIRCLDVCM